MHIEEMTLLKPWATDPEPPPPDTDDGAKSGRTGKDVPPPEQG